MPTATDTATQFKNSDLQDDGGGGVATAEPPAMTESQPTMTAADVSGLMPLFQRGREDPSGLALCVRQELEWMIQHDLHREALHSLWSGVGLALRADMASGKAEKEKKARSLAHAWLMRIGWRGAELTRKQAQLGDCVRHVAHVLHVPG